MEIESVHVVSESGATVTKETVYRDRNGKQKRWSFIERRGGRQAVVVAARTRESGSLVMIRQFRVPFGRDLIELPAGLIDSGETPAQAAHRELAEETGYRGEVVGISPAVSSSAGLTTETFHVVWMVVDERPASETGHEGSEEIQVFTVRPQDVQEILGQWSRAGELLDCKALLVLGGAAAS